MAIWWLLKITTWPRRDKLNVGCAWCVVLLRTLESAGHGPGLGSANSVALFQLLSSKTAYMNRTWMK